MTAADLTLLEAASALRSGDLVVRDLLSASLDRLIETEPDVHAWVHRVPESRLRDEAMRLQRSLDSLKTPSLLHGIPFGVKDLIDTATLPTEAGSAVFRGRQPAVDATCVRSALDGGGLLLGKTHTHEFAFGVRTPAVQNPWGAALARTAGGSSGGSAAAVAAGSCTWAIGTDTLGSVRMPAALCGVVGLKVTSNAIATTGVIPLSRSLDALGVLTRSSADALVAFEVLRRPTLPPLRRSSAPLRIGVPVGLGRVEEGVRAALESAVDRLGGLYEVDRVEIPLFGEHVDVGFGVLLPEAAAWHEPLLRQGDGAPPYEKSIYDSLLAGMQVKAVDYLRAAQARDELAAAFDRLFTEIDVLLTPTTPYVAPLATSAGVRWPDGSAEPLETSMCRFTAVANLTGRPAVSVPVGLSEGLPVGLQLIGNAHSEADLLDVAKTLEIRLRPPARAS